MRITAPQLRRIIRETILQEQNEELSKVMAVLGSNHAKVAKLIEPAGSGTIFSASYLAKLQPSKMKNYLEAMTVYSMLSSAGPDMNYEVILRKLPSIKKKLGDTSIFDAYETNKKLLAHAVEDVGLLGKKSDKYRKPADRYY